MEGEFQFAQSVDGNTTEEIQEALEESIKGLCFFDGYYAFFSIRRLEILRLLSITGVPWRGCNVDCSGDVPRSSIAPEYSA